MTTAARWSPASEKTWIGSRTRANRSVHRLASGSGWLQAESSRTQHQETVVRAPSNTGPSYAERRSTVRPPSPTPAPLRLARPRLHPPPGIRDELRRGREPASGSRPARELRHRWRPPLPIEELVEGALLAVRRQREAGFGVPAQGAHHVADGHRVEGPSRHESRLPLRLAPYLAQQTRRRQHPEHTMGEAYRDLEPSRQLRRRRRRLAGQEERRHLEDDPGRRSFGKARASGIADLLLAEGGVVLIGEADLAAQKQDPARRSRPR